METRSKAIFCRTTPTLAESARIVAFMRRESINEKVNQWLSAYVEENAELIKAYDVEFSAKEIERKPIKDVERKPIKDVSK